MEKLFALCLQALKYTLLFSIFILEFKAFLLLILLGQGNEKANSNTNIILQFSSCTNTVSYTHLDVYKRQI